MRLLFNSSSNELKLNDINCGKILSTSEYADMWVFETVEYKESIFDVFNQNNIEYEIRPRIHEGFYLCDIYIKFPEPQVKPPILTFHLEKSKIKLFFIMCNEVVD